MSSNLFLFHFAVNTTKLEQMPKIWAAFEHLLISWCIFSDYHSWFTFVLRKVRHLFKFSAFCTRRSPLLGLPRFSPEMISSSFMRIFPSAKSLNRSWISSRAWNRELHTCITYISCCIVIHIVSSLFKYFGVLICIDNKIC